MVRNLLFAFFPLWFYGQNWQQLPAFPGLSRDDGVAVNVAGKAYVGSGLTSGWTYGADFYCYDMSTQSWSVIAPMPSGTERQYACAFKGGNGFFVFGGDGIGGTLNNLYEYNVSSNNWTQKSSKPGLGIYGASCFVFGDTAIIAGGRFPGNLINNEVWMYRISSDSWQQLNNMPPAFGGRWRAAYSTLFGKGYMLFGLDANLAWRKELLEYNPQFDSWNKIMDVNNFPSLAYASMQSVGGSLVVFGGVDSLNNYANAFHYFELSSSTWSQGPMFSATPRRGGMSWIHNKSFNYSCGLDENEQRLNESWMLDIVTSNRQEMVDDKFFIGPNPFSQNISIHAAEACSIQVYDKLGILMFEGLLKAEEEIQLNAECWFPGLYILKCDQGQKQIAVNKLLKH